MSKKLETNDVIVKPFILEAPPNSDQKNVEMKGLFAKHDLSSYTIIGNYPGKLVSHVAFSKLANSGLYAMENEPLRMRGEEKFIHVPTGKKGQLLKAWNNVTLYANEPSLRYVNGIKNLQTLNAALISNHDTGKMQLITIKPIKQDEEILIYYGPNYEVLRNYNVNVSSLGKYTWYIDNGNVVCQWGMRKPVVKKKNPANKLTFKKDPEMKVYLRHFED